MEGTYNGAPNPPAVQSEFTLYSELGAHPIFLHAPDAMFASNITFAARNEILAKAIPALSPPAGKARIGMKNFNMNVDGRPQNGSWGRNDADYQSRWLHSDMKDMALFYTYRFFDQAVSAGGLK